MDGVGMYVTKDASSEEYEIYDHPGMQNVKRRRFLNPENSSKNFALRAYIIEPGGHTSYDTHPHEHGVYMLSGEATVKVGAEELLLQPGDVLHISGNEPHQFFNRGSEYVKFLCVRDFTSSS
ncbi:MAG: cupin domain-containing protein [Candidatus Thorarchaeota archaeon]|jgi:quercetin dioxygenase-like cupin family protein